MKTDKERGEEILKKRRMADKGLNVRKDGKPIDPAADAGSLDIDKDPVRPESTAEKEGEVARRGIAGSLLAKR
jgi:hypothetical protein